MPDPLSDRWRRPARVYLVGIGGVGMAGLARLLLQAGFRVSGSDSRLNRLCLELRNDGAEIREGHAVDNLPRDIDWAVRTPAVAGDNPEITALRNRGIPVFIRGDVLAAYARNRPTLAVAGAHGKTTTSAMLAHMLRENGVDCGYAIGGETSLPHRVADTGRADWFVCEADESDASLVRYSPEVGVLTHIEWDHVERFPTERSLMDCYRAFVRQCERLWLREDDVLAMSLAREHGNFDLIGESGCAIQLLDAVDDPEGQTLCLEIEGRRLKGRLPLPGRHNAWNLCLALGAALECGLEPSGALAAMDRFQSVGRRFQKLAAGGVTLIQDYAHHPTEIRAVMSSARALEPSRLFVVFQPHRYSRTKHLLNAFAESFSGADRLDLLPVYAASELPGQGIGVEELAKKCHGMPVNTWTTRAKLTEKLIHICREGDVVLIAGAGDIELLQAELADRLGNAKG